VPRRGYLLELQPVTPAAPHEAAAGDSSAPVPSSEGRASPQPAVIGRDIRLFPRAGSRMPSAPSFCERCGARLARLCPNCGHEVSATAQFCRACGAPLGASPPPKDYTPRHLAERILA